MSRTTLLAALLIVSGVAGAFIALRLRPTTASASAPRVTIDTLRYELLSPSVVEAIAEGDSLYTFRDTIDGRWSIELSGSNVALRSMVLLDRVEHSAEYSPPKWEVAIKSGIAPNSMWAGVGVSRNIGALSVSLDAGYDGWRESPYVGLSASFSIWRE